MDMRIHVSWLSHADKFIITSWQYCRPVTYSELWWVPNSVSRHFHADLGYLGRCGPVLELGINYVSHQLTCRHIFIPSSRLIGKNIVTYHSVSITMAARSKTWTVFASSNTGVVGSNPARGMGFSVCVYSVFVLSCIDSGLASCWSPVQWVLPTLHRIRELK
jgi:hypothetical protein